MMSSTIARMPGCKGLVEAHHSTVPPVYRSTRKSQSKAKPRKVEMYTGMCRMNDTAQ